MRPGQHYASYMSADVRNGVEVRLGIETLYETIEAALSTSDEMTVRAVGVRLRSKDAQSQLFQLWLLHRLGKLPPPPLSVGS
jgi:hypothetical protein